jgi:cytochrome c biogenesis protein CcmG/thiol:disulfide interchange protein DsbE
MQRRTLIAVFVAVAFVGLLAYGLIAKGTSGPEVGSEAPEGTFVSLEDGSEASLEDFRGRWVLVNFWASWCEPCKVESPALEKLQQRYGDEEFTVLGIATRDNSDDSREFVREYGLTYPQFRDGDGSLARAWGTTGVPESFLVDPEGRVRASYPGAVDEKLIESEFVSVLKQEGGLQ